MRLARPAVCLSVCRAGLGRSANPHIAMYLSGGYSAQTASSHSINGGGMSCGQTSELTAYDAKRVKGLAARLAHGSHSTPPKGRARSEERAGLRSHVQTERKVERRSREGTELRSDVQIGRRRSHAHADKSARSNAHAARGITPLLRTAKEGGATLTRKKAERRSRDPRERTLDQDGEGRRSHAHADEGGAIAHKPEGSHPRW